MLHDKLEQEQHVYMLLTGFPGGSEVKESAPNAGDPGSIPASGKSPGKGNGNPLQYSCLENLMDRGDWQATVHGVAESDMTERLHFFSFYVTDMHNQSTLMHMYKKQCFMCLLVTARLIRQIWYTQQKLYTCT